MTGKVDIKGTGTLTTIELNGDSGVITAGLHGANGILNLQDAGSNGWWGILANSGNRSFVINKILAPNEAGAFTVISLNGQSGAIEAGGHGVEGHLAAFPAATVNRVLTNANVQLSGADGYLRLGGAGGTGANVVLYPTTAKPADLKDLSKASVRLDGERGDIILANADCAEDFEVVGEAEPGTVMVIGEHGGLCSSHGEYDRRVAGVISGASDLKPGIILGRTSASPTRHPLALTGQVYCKVDADYATVEVGDLLTTSPTRGHAMKATDSARSFGAVIGKALSALHAGQGLLRILVALQ